MPIVPIIYESVDEMFLSKLKQQDYLKLTELNLDIEIQF